ncbi:MAG: ATP-dependent helicase HrpB [Sinimarinibacterium sp.]
MKLSLPQLPVLETLDALRPALAAGCAVLSAPPGSGKTTVVPLALLDEKWLAGRKIVMLEPRRVAARAAARRMASLLGEAVGQTVGYQVRFERRIGSATRIEVVTEGLLARRLQSDPELPDTGLLIFDEFHERSLDADLALALALDARENLRPDLRVLVMSATLDTQRVAQLLGGAPVVESGGQLFPVDIRHRPVPADAEHGLAVANGVVAALRETEGDVLAFLPGAREIRAAQRSLQERLTDTVGVFPLYGELSAQEQDAALLPDSRGRRKVILSTNLAQTSLTVEGVHTVVDGGLVRVARFDLGAGADRLETQRVSRASADQRAGRAGRLGPGVCYRLWSADQQGVLPAYDTPEILAVDLTRFALELAAWGADSPERLRLLDQAPQAAWSYARELLSELEAIDGDGRITAHGRALARLPTTPRRAHMLLRAQEKGLGTLATWVAAALDERDGGSVDLADAVERYLNRRAEPAAQRRVSDAAQQFQRLLGEAAGESHIARPDTAGDIARIVAWAYPERIARRRPGHRGVREVAYQCADGGEARLPEADPLAQQDWLAIAHWQPGPQRRIRLAAAFDEAALRTDHASALRREANVAWDAATETVVAERQLRLGALVLERRPLRPEDGIDTSPAMLEGIRKLGIDVLPWTDAAREWQARVLSLRAWRADEDWPDVGDAALTDALEDWLRPHLAGITRREHLTRLDLRSILESRLDYAAQQRLNRLAPTHIDVPTGSRIRLQYRPPEAPLLSVRLQEMFGCATTPTINDGRTRVVIELLSPAQRPIAVTPDLGGFWAGSYADVKKDMKGRYPRHPWPDNPLAAPPTRRAKPRGT